MPFGWVKAIMAIERINGHTARKRHTSGRGAAPVEHHGQRTAHI